MLTQRTLVKQGGRSECRRLAIGRNGLQQTITSSVAVLVGYAISGCYILSAQNPGQIEQTARTMAATSLVDSPAIGEQWIQLAPVGGLPPARAAASAVFDPNADQMIIFGGTPSGFDFNDVWALTGLSGSPQWVPVSPAGGLPNPRTGHTAVYDASNARMTIFGGGLGQSSPCANDTWVLSNANGINGAPTWAELAPIGGPPIPRIFHTSVYDPASNRMIVFGGNNCFTAGAQFYNDVWVLSNANGLGGTPTWTQLSPTGTIPPARESHTAVYDPGSNRMVIFGGGNSGGILNDVWVLTNANGIGGTPTWKQLEPSGASVPPLIASTAVYDSASNRMTVFAGADGTTGLNTNDVWVLLNANGLDRSPFWVRTARFGTAPPVRQEHTAVYDPATKQMIVFSGTTTPLVFYNDTWVLEGR